MAYRVGEDWFDVKHFGAKGDGVTDDTTAVYTANNALQAQGSGVLYFPPGIFSIGGLPIGSNTVMQGAGLGATTLINNGSTGGFEVVNISWTMSGNSSNWPNNNTTYAINTPGNYTNQVTLTTPSQASNFTVGKWAMVSGGLQGTSFWFPSWWAEVIGVNTTTGVITLAEEIPFEGALLNTIQVVTAIPQNIFIRDMTMIASLDSCVSCFGVQNMIVENCLFLPWKIGGTPAGNFSNGLCVIGQAKNSGMRNCISMASGYELFGASHCFMDSCRCYLGQYNSNGTITQGSTLLIDGGSSDCSITNNFVNAQPSAPPTNWIEVENSPIRIKISGNTVTGMPNGCQGISVTDNNNGGPVVADQNNGNIIMGNSILGVGSPTTSIGISSSSGIVVGNYIENVALGITGTSTSRLFVDANVFKNVIDQGWLSNPPGQLGTDTAWTSVQLIGARPLHAGIATPLVAGGGYFTVSQNSAQTITNLLPIPGGNANEAASQTGMEITLHFFDSLTTLAHASGGTGQMNFVGGAGFNPAQNTVIRFMLDAFGTWIELFRSSSAIT